MKGACCDQEAPTAYNLRLKMALEPLREKAWPWPGTVLVKEQHGEREEVHVINQWCWLGTAQDEGQLHTLIESQAPSHQIELDVYKILVKFMLQPNRKITLKPM
jgi:hypothetical protein